MPTINGVLETTLYVENVERSATFYGETLGFHVVDSSDRLVAMKIAEKQILLLCTKGGVTSDEPIAQHHGEGRFHLALAIPANEYGSWRDALTGKGVAIEVEHDWPLGGRSLYFRDPDGHLVELATPGVWTIY
jgi:catechol 2,3-dioxygenase-like lactoylglutathione lyase family enzyme